MKIDTSETIAPARRKRLLAKQRDSRITVDDESYRLNRQPTVNRCCSIPCTIELDVTDTDGRERYITIDFGDFT